MKLAGLAFLWRSLAAAAALVAFPGIAWAVPEYSEADLSVDPGVAHVAQPVTLRAYVHTRPALPDGVPVLSGTVDFRDADTEATYCSAVPVDTGVASCTVSFGTPGQRNFYAFYSGNADYTWTRSNTVFVLIDTHVAPRATLARSSLYSSPGEPVTFTATLYGDTLPVTGVVDFYEGVTPLCMHVALAGGVAACTVTTLGVGDRFVYGEYSGDDNYRAVPIDTSLHVVLNAPRAGETNVALAAAGGRASASPLATREGYSVASLIDGDRGGSFFGSGSGWLAAWSSVELDLAGPRSVDQVVVYSLYKAGDSILPADTTMWGNGYNADIARNFDVEAWSGAQWVRVASVTANPFTKRIVPFAAVTTERLRINFQGVLAGDRVRLTELEAYGVDYENGSNVALASTGAAASASSELNGDYRVTAVNNNVRAGPWPGGGWWADRTFDAGGWLGPDWLQLDFNGPQTIERVVIYTVPDDYAGAAGLPDSATFTRYGITDFTIDGWDGANWVPLATVTANNLVRRSVEFAPFTTTRIRVNILGGLYYVSRIAEIEAWGRPALPAPVETNWALASNGAMATASSELNADYPASAAIDGDVGTLNWNHGGGWADHSFGSGPDWTGPDWLQVNFAGAKAIDHVVVYTVGGWGNAQLPDDTTTFVNYGIVDFDVLGWNGSGWVTLGAPVRDNNFVKRNVPFAPFTTDRVRVVVSRGMYYVSRIAEIQAWGP